MTNGKNLLPGFGSERWVSVAMGKALAPVFSKTEDEACVAASDSRNSYGRWQCDVAVKPGTDYCFSVEYRAQDIKSENTSVIMLLKWLAEDGELLQGDYAELTEGREDGVRLLTGTAQSPKRAAAVTVELTLKWTDKGQVRFFAPRLCETEPKAHRKVRVATTMIKAAGEMEKNLKLMEEVIDRASVERPDIICLTENFYDRHVEATSFETSEAIPGRLTDAMGRKAKQYGAYLVFSMHERDGEYMYNTAVLIGRDGEIKGKYRKTHPAMEEGERQVTPGDEYAVFDTDFGKIGMLICWDAHFPEPSRILRLLGAEMVFIPSAGNFRLQVQARALDNSMYVVISCGNNGEDSRIIAPTGEELAHVADLEKGYVCREIDLDERFYEYWLSVGAAYGDPHKVCLKERRSETYGLLCQS